MQIQMGPMCFKSVVCIHKPSTSSSLIVPTLECETVSPPTPHLITGPHARLHSDLPHPRSYHFTYITVDQACISLMEPVPSCPQTGGGEWSCTTAEITPVSSKSAGAQEVQIKDSFETR